ncbi:MAG: hypothetical protein GC168_03220 [Candidatus Hydrogenedens sp.]|nr:hypothetical protein [Candidatus Hydrogenedens sp.]
MSALLIALAMAATSPSLVVLESPWMRIEFDTALGAIRYLGSRDGVNFVEPLHVSKADIRQGHPLDPGGLAWELSTATASEPVLLGKPMTVLSHSETHLSLRPANEYEALPEIRIDIRLSESDPSAVMEVTVGGLDDVEPAAMRVLCRVSPTATVHAPDAPNPTRRLSLYPDAFTLAAQGRTAETLVYNKAETETRLSGHTLLRQCEAIPAPALYVVDDEFTGVSGTVVESRWDAILPGQPHLYRETWTLSGTDE